MYESTRFEFTHSNIQQKGTLHSLCLLYEVGRDRNAQKHGATNNKHSTFHCSNPKFCGRSEESSREENKQA